MSVVGCHVLTGEELITVKSKDDRELPFVGQKDFNPTNSWLEKKQIQSTLSEKKALLEEERVEKGSCLSSAIWRPDVKKAEVNRKLGKQWEIFGHHIDDADWLYPEEAMLLLETNSLELTYHEIPLSIERGYVTLINLENGCTLNEYRTYSHLIRNGYRLFRHSANVSVTRYEKQINLEQHFLKQKEIYITGHQIAQKSVVTETTTSTTVSIDTVVEVQHTNITNGERISEKRTEEIRDQIIGLASKDAENFDTEKDKEPIIDIDVVSLDIDESNGLECLPVSDKTHKQVAESQDTSGIINIEDDDIEIIEVPVSQKEVIVVNEISSDDSSGSDECSSSDDDDDDDEEDDNESRTSASNWKRRRPNMLSSEQINVVDVSSSPPPKNSETIVEPKFCVRVNYLTYKEFLFNRPEDKEVEIIDVSDDESAPKKDEIEVINIDSDPEEITIVERNPPVICKSRIAILDSFPILKYGSAVVQSPDSRFIPPGIKPSKREYVVKSVIGNDRRISQHDYNAGRQGNYHHQRPNYYRHNNYRNKPSFASNNVWNPFNMSMNTFDQRYSNGSFEQEMRSMAAGMIQVASNLLALPYMPQQSTRMPFFNQMQSNNSFRPRTNHVFGTNVPNFNNMISPSNMAGPSFNQSNNFSNQLQIQNSFPNRNNFSNTVFQQQTTHCFRGYSSSKNTSNREFPNQQPSPLNGQEPLVQQKDSQPVRNTGFNQTPVVNVDRNSEGYQSRQNNPQQNHRQNQHIHFPDWEGNNQERAPSSHQTNRPSVNDSYPKENRQNNQDSLIEPNRENQLASNRFRNNTNNSDYARNDQPRFAPNNSNNSDLSSNDAYSSNQSPNKSNRRDGFDNRKPMYRNRYSFPNWKRRPWGQNRGNFHQFRQNGVRNRPRHKNFFNAGPVPQSRNSFNNEEVSLDQNETNRDHPGYGTPGCITIDTEGGDPSVFVEDIPIVIPPPERPAREAIFIPLYKSSKAAALFRGRYGRKRKRPRAESPVLCIDLDEGNNAGGQDVTVLTSTYRAPNGSKRAKRQQKRYFNVRTNKMAEIVDIDMEENSNSIINNDGSSNQEKEMESSSSALVKCEESGDVKPRIKTESVCDKTNNGQVESLKNVSHPIKSELDEKPDLASIGEIKMEIECTQNVGSNVNKNPLETAKVKAESNEMKIKEETTVAEISKDVKREPDVSIKEEPERSIKTEDDASASPQVVATAATSKVDSNAVEVPLPPAPTEVAIKNESEDDNSAASQPEEEAASWAHLKRITGPSLQPVHTEEASEERIEIDENTEEGESQKDEESLLTPENCRTLGTVLTTLQVIGPADFSGSSVKKLKISFDVYTPNTSTKKTTRGLPNYRLVILGFSDPVPSAGEIAELSRRFEDNVPILMAVVLPDSISFFSAGLVNLPQFDQSK